jgi:hypothetical protein
LHPHAILPAASSHTPEPDKFPHTIVAALQACDHPEPLSTTLCRECNTQIDTCSGKFDTHLRENIKNGSMSPRLTCFNCKNKYNRKKKYKHANNTQMNDTAAQHNIKVAKIPTPVSVPPSSSTSTNEFDEFKVLEFSTDRHILRTPSFSGK